uniref:Uncharacterized protein n=1 Tax=Caenorhabditis japonica TaxID=281687 RepID=A0A8R1DMF1_CAEJA
MGRYPACNNDSQCLQSICECDERFINCLAKYPYPNSAKKCPFYDGDPLRKYLSTLAPKSDAITSSLS